MIFFSNELLPDENIFQGYAFCEDDYICGNQGLEDFKRKTGRKIGPGQDGCYVSVEKVEDRWIVGTDYSGFRKVFVHRDGNDWSIGTSFFGLAERLARHGRRLTINFPALRALSINHSFTQQLASHQTIFNEIRLIPSWCSLAIDGTSLELISEPRKFTQPYDRTIQSHVEVWSRRFETLLREPRASVSCDISGGQDTRVVLAILLRAMRRCGPDIRAHVRFSSSTHEKFAPDLKIAKIIAETYGLRLNGPAIKRPRAALSAQESFDVWKYRDIGIYHPLYPASFRCDPLNFQLSGGGGENYRPFYRGNSVGDMVPKLAGADPDDPLFLQWLADVTSDCGNLGALGADLPPLIRHYRAFRNRIHAGLIPQTRIIVAPLAGRDLDPTSAFNERLLASQVNFDLMATAMPGIMELPFDTKGKEPDESHRAILVAPEVTPGASAGSVWAADPPEGEQIFNTAQFVKIMNDELQSALTSPIANLFSEAMKSKAREQMRIAIERGSFSFALHAIEVTRLVSAARCFGIATAISDGLEKVPSPR